MDDYPASQEEMDTLLDESDAIRTAIGIQYGTGVLPVLEELARTYPYLEVWEMTKRQLDRYPPKRSPRGYIPKVVATAVRELGYRPLRVTTNEEDHHGHS